MASKMYDPDYWLCSRCNEYKLIEEFYGRPVSAAFKEAQEYKLCRQCRKPLKGRRRISIQEHARRREARGAFQNNDEL